MPRTARILSLALAALCAGAATGSVAQTVRAPVIGGFAIDPADHDPAPTAPDPLPIETSADLDSMIAADLPRAMQAPADGGRAGIGRIEHGAVGRLAQKIGGDEIVVPVLTVHLGPRRR